MLERRELVQKVAHQTLRRRMLVSRIVVASTGLALLIALVPLVAILYSLVSKGAHWWHVEFFTQVPQFPSLVDPNAVGGIANAMIGSLVIDGIAAIFAIPIGIITGLFLAESSSRFANGLRKTAEIMTGLPSILLGIFAYQMIVVGFHDWGINIHGIGFSAIAGSFAIGVLMVPIIIKASENSLRSVPQPIREAGLGSWGSQRGVGAKCRDPDRTAGAHHRCAAGDVESRRGDGADPVGDRRFQHHRVESPPRDGIDAACHLPVSHLSVCFSQGRDLGDRVDIGGRRPSP